MTTNNDEPSLIKLPEEILLQILDLAIPVQHLCVQRLTDRMPTSPDSPSGIPGVFLLTKSIYERAVPIFYSRAVLNTAPLRPPPYLFNTLSGPSLRLNLRTGLDVLFASCNPHHLARIAAVNIYSSQHDAINAEAYEALLGWLVDNTGVKQINLSNRLMTRLRRGRTDLNAVFNLATATPPPTLTRTIYIYSTHPRTPWESLRMAELQRALKDRHLPTLQSLIFENRSGNDPFLDPRWDVRKSDDDQKLLKVDKVAFFLDDLIAADPMCSTRSASASRCLYHVLFVVEPSLRVPG
ncbi:uncharacterized protein A1O9_00219 [Exophiala aquamarina CBS 119918]|uniref:F-box domain-containing protein n=1 Tax=Exophiala aquamarina CBS 119918 TaxID=1182545 RepID=A0A072PR85_9EURO|nr:uncharacterized protein A1O9_00219 [Exophiala aquamarina CBS 119918]KEF62247.1 hypothetical protein A1O9_00219 [Exophiala aquamarina CBS 119918]